SGTAAPAASGTAAPAASGTAALAASGTAAPAAPAAPAASAAAASPSASGAPQGIVQWADSTAPPGARTGAAGFSANGAPYPVGGSDGSSAKKELYWALPDASGNLPGGWFHLGPTDLTTGVVDAAPVVTGSTVEIIGGRSDDTPLTSAYRASLAPQAPFFRLGLVGVTVPALQIGGEIGQQLGYLAAAGVGTGNFVILIIIGWAFNHRPQIRPWMSSRSARSGVPIQAGSSSSWARKTSPRSYASRPASNAARRSAAAIGR